MRAYPRYDDSDVLKTEQNPSAQTFYVESDGDDNSGNGSVDNPFLTIARALREISLESQFPHTIQLGAGSFALPNDISNFNQFIQGSTPSSLTIQGTTSTAASYTVSTVVAGSQAAGIRVRVTGTPAWTNGQHIGKIIRWTSGSQNNRYGVIYDNDADSIWVTTDRAISYASVIPATSDTFNLLSHDTTIALDTNKSLAASILIFQDLKITGAYIISTTLGNIQWTRCYVNNNRISVGNSSFVRLITSYAKSNGDTLVVNTSSNSVFSPQSGAVIDGNSAQGLSFDPGTAVFQTGEVVFARLPAAGIACMGITFVPTNTTDTMRFYSCVGGFIDSANNLAAPSFVNLPFIAGSVSANFFIVARHGSQYRINNGNVTTGLAVNNASSINGTNQSYFDPQNKTRIFCLANENDNVLAANATTIDVSHALAEEPMWQTVANGGATAITDFTGGRNGQVVIVRGGSSTNATTIADGGNFELVGGATITFNADVQAAFRKSGAVWREIWRRAA